MSFQAGTVGEYVNKQNKQSVMNVGDRANTTGILFFGGWLIITFDVLFLEENQDGYPSGWLEEKFLWRENVVEGALSKLFPFDSFFLVFRTSFLL